MEENIYRQLSEILKKAQNLHGSLNKETEKVLTSDRIENIIQRFNTLIIKANLCLDKIPILNSWMGGGGEGHSFAYRVDIIGAGLDYSREKDSIEYSSKTYTPDFTFPTIDVALEIKFSGKREREKQMIAEINDDILAYQTKYKNLIFLVYDTGFIRDVDLFSNSYGANKNVYVEVIKH